MKTKMLILISLIAFEVNAQWTQQNSNTTSDLTSIHGIGDTLFTVGPTAIRKTFDGGATTWATVNALGTSGTFIKMYDKNKIVLGRSNGTIVRSLNGGTSWTSVNGAGGSTLIGFYDVEFLNDSTYVAVGGSPSNFLNGGQMISKTTNSGTSWTVKVNNSTAPTALGIEGVKKQSMFGPLSILLECGGGKSINQTSGDHVTVGNSWSNVMNNATGNISFFDINFPNDSVGYIVGGKVAAPTTGGVMYKTLDYGVTWTAVTLPVTNNMYGVHFISADTGYIVGNGGLIYKTVNGGTNWVSESSGVTTELNKIYFTSSKVGYIVGDGGIILKMSPAVSPTTAAAGTDQTLCNTTTATLAGNTPSVGTGAWTVTSGTAIVTNSTSATSGITGLTIGGSATLRWTITNGSLSSIDSVVITVDAPPTTAAAGTDQYLTSVTTATLAGNTPSIGTGLWTLVSGTANITSPTSPTSGITGLVIGTATLRWTISNGTCSSSSDDVVIDVSTTTTSINEINRSSYKILTGENITIEYNSQMKGEFILFNSLGQQEMIKDISGNSIEISNLKPGVYYFLLGNSTGKFIK